MSDSFHMSVLLVGNGLSRLNLCDHGDARAVPARHAVSPGEQTFRHGSGWRVKLRVPRVTVSTMWCEISPHITRDGMMRMPLAIDKM